MNFPEYLKGLLLNLAGDIVALLQYLIEQYLSLAIPIKIGCPILMTIICFHYQIINNPTGAINTFMIFLFDSFYQFFPSTPAQYKISNLLLSFASAYPQVGWGIVFEVFQGMAVMFALWGMIKMLKILPFT